MQDFKLFSLTFLCWCIGLKVHGMFIWYNRNIDLVFDRDPIKFFKKIYNIMQYFFFSSECSLWISMYSYHTGLVLPSAARLVAQTLCGCHICYWNTSAIHVLQSSTITSNIQLLCTSKCFWPIVYNFLMISSLKTLQAKFWSMWML